MRKRYFVMMLMAFVILLSFSPAVLADDSFATATLISAGSRTGYLDSYDTVDYFKIYVTSGQVINASMTPPSNADFDLYLYDPYQSQVDSSTSGTGITDSVSHTATSSGYHYIKVSRYSGSGYYTLTVSTLSAPTLSSPSSGSTTANTTPYFGWSSVSGAYYYEIEVDDSSYFSSPAIDTTTYSSYYTPTTSLSAGTYYWHVRAVDYSYNSSSWSSTWSFTIMSAPTLSSPSSGSTTYDTTPTFSWYSVSGADYYQIQVDDSSYFSSPAIDTTTSPTSYTPTTSLSPDTCYWRVRGYNYSSGYGSWSSSRYFTVKVLSAPTPSSPSSYSETTNTTPHFSWYSVSDAHSYQIQVDTSSSFYSPDIDATTYSTSYTPTTSLSPDTYYWRVRACDSSGNYGSWSSARSVTISPSATGTVIAVLLALIIVGGIVGGIIYAVSRQKRPPAPRPKPTPSLARPKPPTAPPKKEVVVKPTPKRIERKLTPEQIESKVYKYLKRHRGELDVGKCAERLGVSEDEVERAARALVTKGKLEEE